MTIYEDEYRRCLYKAFVERAKLRKSPEILAAKRAQKRIAAITEELYQAQRDGVSQCFGITQRGVRCSVMFSQGSEYIGYCSQHKEQRGNRHKVDTAVPCSEQPCLN